MLPCKDGTRLPNAFRRAPPVTSFTSNHILAATRLTAAPMNDPGSFGSYYRMSGGARPLGEDQVVTAILHDETPLTRESLSTSLNLCGRGVRVLTAATLADLESVVRRRDGAPDVALANFSGRLASDPDFRPRLAELLAVLDGIPLIILSDSDETATALEAIRQGAHGYISTTVGLTMALEAIRMVAAGGIFVPATILHRLIIDQAGMPDPVRHAALSVPASAVNGKPHLTQLTPRQLAVLECLQEGKPNKVIAHELGMRESTVKVHVRNILRRLGATNRTEAVCRVMREEN
ncbi:response regulator transcription factor [Azospirillum sp. YIM DDC1]|uniref:Response regulator transcription factor n=1 Tax=Azospirillum aestuarii TaxID=2802052 RepID=A0ABS1HXF3_9PROT|nr:response regulator transcription factor [Azospirillum aestuarii]MBK3775355.1 DNA-binding response regulator [Azospirillum brasilense]MBK4719503.1 response regulator transcription factor [Azospirillum aestuarii]TWA91757.1 DNA-binding NarL/FixJ family response regulator [Azospirillum brasilense]